MNISVRLRAVQGSDQRVGPSFFNSIKGDGLTFFFLAVA
jgi:hypothetical protein